MIKKNLREKYISFNCNKTPTDEIFSFIESLNIKNISLYMPFSNEIKTDVLKAYLIKNKYGLYFPFMRKTSDSYEIEFHMYNGILIRDDYRIHSYNGKKIEVNELDAVIMPGIAFNTSGFRLGYGKAFYDKALRDFKGIKIGFIDEKCLIEEHFEEKHDIQMDYIVTDKRIIKIK